MHLKAHGSFAVFVCPTFCVDNVLEVRKTKGLDRRPYTSRKQVVDKDKSDKSDKSK